MHPPTLIRHDSTLVGIGRNWMWVLVDNEARMNFMTPTYVKEHEMTVDPVEELAMNPSRILIQGMPY